MAKNNKGVIVDAVQEALDITKADAERAVDTVISTIVDALKAGGELSIAGFGTFVAKKRAARTARNPKTGEPVQVPATTVPKFKPAKNLKEVVKAGK